MASQERVKQLAAHFKSQSSSGKDAVFRKNADDIVITLAIRSPLTSSRKGGLKGASVEELLYGILKGVRELSKIDVDLVEEIVVGNVLEPRANYMARAASIAAGFPVTTAASVVGRWCSSGLLATQSVANQIKTGCIDIGIAIGVESMSTNPDGGAPPFGPHVLSHPIAEDLKMPMGWTSENLAGDFGISRAVQDEWAAESFQKAQIAQEAGWSKDEIYPLEITKVDTTTGKSTISIVDRDDGIRQDTTKESLAKIRAAFPQWPPSTTTGGNASQISDGIAAVLLMRRETAIQLKQPILGKYVASTVAALEPRIMGAGPVFAVPKLLKKVGLSKEDIDLWEINEAFASVLVHCVTELGIDRTKVNPRGGAIALGHPLGCTGVRQIVTALSELKRTRKTLAVTSMCVGTGMGMAALIVSEQ